MSLIAFSFKVPTSGNADQTVVIDSDELVLLCRVSEERTTAVHGSVLFTNDEIATAMRLHAKGLGNYIDEYFDAPSSNFYSLCCPSFLGLKVVEVAFGLSSNEQILSARHNFEKSVAVVASMFSGTERRAA